MLASFLSIIIFFLIRNLAFKVLSIYSKHNMRYWLTNAKSNLWLRTTKLLYWHCQKFGINLKLLFIGKQFLDDLTEEFLKTLIAKPN